MAERVCCSYQNVLSIQNRVCCLYRVSTTKQVDHDDQNQADIPVQRNAQLTELNEEVEKSNQRIEAIKADYRRIMEWSEMFDGSDMDVKKMIAGYIIQRVDVYSEYRLHIEFNMSFAQFELGLETEVEYAAQDIVS